MKNLLKVTLILFLAFGAGGFTGCSSAEKGSTKRKKVQTNKDSKTSTPDKKPDAKSDTKKTEKKPKVNEQKEDPVVGSTEKKPMKFEGKTPRQTTEFFFACAKKGDMDGINRCSIPPKDKRTANAFSKMTSEEMKRLYEDKVIKVLDGKVFGKLAVVAKCEFSKQGALKDIDAMFTRNINGTWKLILTPNAMAVKNELSSKEDLQSYDDAFKWLRKNGKKWKETAKKLKL